MKKNLTAILFAMSVCSAVFCNAAATEYDFSSKDVLTSGSVPLTLRGKAQLTTDGLKVYGSSTNSDAVTSKGVYAAMTPADAFTFTAEFTIDKADKAINRYIFDNKYISMPGTDPKRQVYHRGFAAGLRKYGNGFKVFVNFGYGSQSVEIYTGVVNIAYGKKHTLEIDFDGCGSVIVYLNGKAFSRSPVPAGKLAASKQMAAFGNRIGSSFYPLNGTLHKVVFSDLKDRSVPAGTILAKWDFSDPASYANMNIRGKNTKIANGAIEVMTPSVTAPGGITTVDIFPDNTPSRAFELEAEFALSSQYKRFKNYQAMLIDSKYVSRPGNKPKDMPRHTGFMVSIQPRGNGKYRFNAAFGFGKTSSEVYSKDITLEMDKFYNLKMLFTATGKVVFTLDGNVVGECTVPSGSLAPATLPTTIGDRHGSNYNPFGGSIKKIIIKEAEFTPVSAAPSAMHRQVFERGETPEAVVKVQNALLKPLNDVVVEMNIAGLAPVKKKLS